MSDKENEEFIAFIKNMMENSKIRSEIVYTVYVLYSVKYDKKYTGYTSDLLKRFASHNGLSKKGYTYRYRPWIVNHLEYYNSKSAAISREKFLKSGKGREWIKSNVAIKNYV